MGVESTSTYLQHSISLNKLYNNRINHQLEYTQQGVTYLKYHTFFEASEGLMTLFR